MSNSRKAFRKLALVNNASFTSTPSTNLLANPALATSYNLTLPSTTPTAPGQSLISDTNGLLSWGSATASVSTFTGTTNPLTTPTNVTGLQPTTTSSMISVYVTINASTNIYSLYNLKVYQKGSATSWGLAYDQVCDTDDVDPQVLFTVTSTGQIQYTLPNTIAGFTSIVFIWTLGTSVSNTLTSLSLSSTLNVTGLATHGAMTGLSLLLGNAAGSGAVSLTSAPYLIVQNQTYTDTVTVASGTTAGSFAGSYLGIPTLAATNTAVTTPIASTLTIAGAPVAGTNETITNAYALNVLGGNSIFGGNLNVNGVMTGPRTRKDNVQLSGTAAVNFGSTGTNYYIPLSGGSITASSSVALGTMMYFGSGFDCFQNTDTVTHYWLMSISLQPVGNTDFFWYEVGTQKANSPYANTTRYSPINANTSNGTALCYVVPVPAGSYVHVGRYGLTSNTSTNYVLQMTVVDVGIF